MTCKDCYYNDNVHCSFVDDIEFKPEDKKCFKDRRCVGNNVFKEVVHAYWIEKPIAGDAYLKCSVCNKIVLDNIGGYNYCPHCGATMDDIL